MKNEETSRQRRKRLEREDLDRLKNFSGPAFMGYLMRTFGRSAREPQFIRRGYEAGIIDELRDFYARRPRPWRPRNRDSCKPTFKEQRAQRPLNSDA